MTKKKYLAVFIVIGVLLVLAVVFFFVAMPFREDEPVLFGVFTTITYSSVLGAVLMIAINYKKLVAFDLKKRAEALPATFFEVCYATLDRAELERRIAARGYTCAGENIFSRTATVGKEQYEYHALVAETKGEVDVVSYLSHFSHGARIVNTVFLFANDVAADLSAMHGYIKDTLSDIIQHRYSYEKFFVPVVIARDRIYCLRPDGFYGQFAMGVQEILSTLQIKEVQVAAV